MKRAKHSLSNYKLFTGNMGKLIPIGCYEVLPGDTIQQATSALIRIQPLNGPVMHPVHVKIHHWFVPNRLVWSEWQDFITGGRQGTSAPTFPTYSVPNGASFAVGSLGDYLGIKPELDEITVSALPFRAYSLIFNEFYRDQWLTDPVTVSTASGADTTTNVALLDAPWEKDYFTSARPEPQLGPDVTIPIVGTAEVTLNRDTPPLTNWRTVNVATGLDYNSTALEGKTSPVGDLGDAGGANIALDPMGTLEVSGEDFEAINMNQFRTALAVQRFEEARARYGARYTEYLRYLGVRSSDARLQRPEYLGGGKQTIQFSEVLQTGVGNTENDTPLGTLGGHGISSLRSNRYRRFFEEHGYVITLMTVRPKTIYADGLHRHWNRRTKLDYWQKELQHIGQQEILNKEIYLQGDNSALNDETWGYQDRYDEYRRIESTIAGEMRTTLDYYHYARMFDSLPGLNSAFVKCDPTDRVYAVQDADQMVVMAQHSIQARRLVAKIGKSFIY